MFELAFSIGSYAYLIFFVGLMGYLYKSTILGVSSILLLFLVWLLIRNINRNSYIHILKKIKQGVCSLYRQQIFSLFLVLFLLQILVNLLGALGPELAFDSLWYHLTLPKLYLLHHSIYFIRGGLLYYSAMPKLAEMLYVGALSFGGEIFAKLVHFMFGLLSCIALYLFARKYLTKLSSLIAVLIFYTNLVVGWESITAFVELPWTFFTILALWSLLNWYETDQNKWFLVSAVMVGFSITTKILAIGTLAVFLLMLLVFKNSGKNRSQHLLIQVVLYSIISLLIPAPWFIFSFIHTGNPMYPNGTSIYRGTITSPNPLTFITSVWNLFIHATDPVSPLYLIFLPLVIYFFSKLNDKIKPICIFSLFAIIVWYFTPQSGGGRFIVPYLPAMSVVLAAVLEHLRTYKTRLQTFVCRFLFYIILLVASVSIMYRFVANYKFIPVVFGRETKAQFLTKNLNFSFGDFYDTDQYFANHITKQDIVLLYGFHNLYYVDFPFTDETWIQKGDRFSAITTQNTKLPERFNGWRLIYSNPKTLVKLYRSASCKPLCTY